MTSSSAIVDPNSLRVLSVLPELLQQAVQLFPDDLRPASGFSLFEQVWHLADVELEVYAVRIRRLLEEERPFFADYDGGGVAEARGYATRSVSEAVARFTAARLLNLALLRRVRVEDWARQAEQEKVGQLSLAELPKLIVSHDAEHARELETLFAGQAGAEPLLAGLRTIYESPLAVAHAA